MKYFTVILFIAIYVGSCSSSKQASTAKSPKPELTVMNSDSTEYELIVFDPKFDSFLALQALPKNYYTNNYYQNWNLRYCVEWNIRHSNPLRYGDFYETQIDYQHSIDYGIDFNYKLYQYFQFIEKEYNIVLIRRRGR